MARERLFRVLDEKRGHPVVWIAGPPGSGKTTLVASYLEVARSPAIWYLLDRGDSDPATFFYYVAQATGAASRSRGKSLPLLTPEYLPDLEGFSRRFFRDFFGRLPECSLLVLDNYQEIAADSALHRMLNAAIAEVPQSANLLVISRAPPPGLFARAQVAGSLDMLGWEELRLMPDETAAIVARRETPDPEVVATLHVRSGGWVAGVRLLLQAETSLKNDALSTGPEGLESAFDYFAAEFFDGAPESLRLVLLRTAFFPRFTIGMAVAITGDPDAGEQIEQLYRRRLFIDRRLGNEATYQYHDLFRAFLRNRANDRLPPEEIASVTARSAGLLTAANLADEAFGLFVQAKDWAHAEEIFLDHAPRLISSGRWLTLDDWANSLPKERLAANPWLLYWLGRSKALVDPVQAYPTLEAAYKSFTEGEDNLGQLLCAAEVVETLHFAVTRFEAMGLWLERLERSLGAQKTSLQTDDELRVHSTLFWAAENSDPGSPVIEPSVARVQQLLPHCTDVNLRISVANMLHYHSVRSMDPESTRIAMREARPFLDSAALSADRLALYLLAEGMAHVDPGRYEDALSCYDRADAVIEAHGLAGRDHIARVWRAMCQYAAGDVQNAHATLARIETLRSEDLPVIAQVLLNARAWVAFSRNDIESALKHVQAAIDNIDKWGPSIVLGWLLPNQAYMRISAGRTKQAREPLKRIRSQSWLVSYGHFQGAVALLEAWEALRLGEENRSHAALRECMRLAQDQCDRLRMRWYPKALAELLPSALELGIETDTARTLIRECRLDPPAHTSDTWSWPVKVYTLGRFEILIDEKPLGFGRKTPKRTLALLKALIALGGTDVSEQKLIDSLWPDQEADAAVESLAAALHRLRRLLGGNDLIRQNGGLLSLNAQRTFVDAWAFEAGTDDPAKRGLALKLYGGNFLHGDNEPWTASLRERLRGKFVRTVENACLDFESSGQWQEAIELYVRGIGTDDLIEPFYRGLMRCYSNLGRHAEAAGAFRRLRQTLSVTLGTRPSAESQRLFETLRLQ
ncbi:MAG: hypothetical protein HY067_20605 [Betaproteobacteria bacterium]|nr:hypothetical protein [Betaproteobacteria bacterium]